jgi:hypothetical protein
MYVLVPVVRVGAFPRVVQLNRSQAWEMIVARATIIRDGLGPRQDHPYVRGCRHARPYIAEQVAVFLGWFTKSSRVAE